MDPVCGCEEAGVSFCTYDFGDSGSCEACSDPGAGADVSGGNWGCYNRGLPEAGAADCVKWCTAPPAMPPPPPEPEPWYQGYCSQDVGPTACAYCSARSCAERTGDYTACVLLTEADVTVELTDVSDEFPWASGADSYQDGPPQGVGPHNASVTIALPAGIDADQVKAFLDTLNSTIYVGADFSGTTMALYQVHEV